MPKIKVEVELEVLDNEYCDDEDTTCPMCLEGDLGQYHCALFDCDLETDEENHYCKRCEKCNHAEVE